MTKQKPDNDIFIKKEHNSYGDQGRNVRGSAESSANGQSQPQYHEDEIDLVDYIKVAYKYRWMIIVIVCISTLLTGAFSFMKPKMYEANATFFPMDVKYSVESQGSMMQPTIGIKDFIILIFESRKMTDRVIDQLNLDEPAKKKLMLKNSLTSSVKIQIRKNGLIKLSAQSKSPELSAKIANAYVDNLDYFNRQLDIVAQRNIVQVIDRATVPEVRMSRGTVRKTFLAGMASFMFAIFLAFFIEFVKNSNLKNRLKEN